MKPNDLVRTISVLIIASGTLTAQLARQQAVIPLKNWTTPLYWQPNQKEREAAAQAIPQKGGAQLVFSSNQVSSNALTFVAITPCRLIDTRGASANFNGISPFSGPSIGPMTTVTFPVQSTAEATADTEPAPCGTIPSIAQAYSMNVTVVPHTALGAVDYISIWPAGGTQPYVSTVDDPQGLIVANAAIVPAGTPMGGINVFNFGPTTADVVIDMNGFFAAPSDLNGNTAVGGGGDLGSNTSGQYNTALGVGVLAGNTTGSNNSASGFGALFNNTTGGGNTASGAGAMFFNITGSNNTASGFAALNSNTTGNNNTASGQAAMQANTSGCCNVAVGQAALNANTIGNANVAIGGSALQDNVTGNNNTATGQAALLNNTGNNNTATGQAAMLNNTSGCCNTASGQAALNANTTGSSNVAIGGSALQDNVIGNNNTATGQGALLNNTADNNTADGQGALNANTTGVNNTAVGQGAMSISTTGNGNTSIGNGSLRSNISGFQNTAIGISALANSTGNTNIAVGEGAGSSLTTGSNNIDIGNSGVSGEGSIIRIGSSQTSAYIAGIWNNTPNATNLLVCVDANGDLGTTGCTNTPSSRRFKERITDMGDTSSKLLQLRPVTFFYKPEYDDGSHTLQYGLIAEEVAKLYPDMVGYDKDGQPSSVKYQSLAPMLLNEVQKLQERLAALETLLSSQPSTATRPASSQ